MWHSHEIRFGLDHPTAAGHFPGNPIIPGAVLLDEAIDAIAGAGSPADAIVIRSAKFFQPVRPGEAVHIRWRSRADGQIAFECRVLNPERRAAAGTVQIRRAGS
jgi:3-hydroxyacyl-[acyl-carrier-protein] dehydratase